MFDTVNEANKILKVLTNKVNSLCCFHIFMNGFINGKVTVINGISFFEFIR